MSGREPDKDARWAQEVSRRAARRAFWLARGERPLARNLAMIGALGWLIVAPTLVALFLGRWIDHRAGGGIFWTGALLMVGLAIGCWLAWRRIVEVEREGP